MKKFILFILLILAYIQATNAQPKPQDSTDLIWSNRIADQSMGFYMVKFSKNDSLIVAHGYTQDLFIDAKTGQEIHRIDGNNEIFFINIITATTRLEGGVSLGSVTWAKS